MTTLQVYYNAEADLFADAAHGLNDQSIRGVLTTEHAASSYGMPVFVRDDGQVMGPADIGRFPLGSTERYTEELQREAAELVAAARLAGYMM